MKCVKQGLLVVLLAFLVLSPAFCGWDAFRSSSSESSIDSLDITKETAVETPTAETPSQKTSSTEDKIESNPISENSKSYEENSESYEEKLTETKDLLEDAKVEAEAEKSDRKAEKKMETIEKAQAVVEDLIASKEALDENYNILADLALQQMKDIKHLERQKAFKAGIGLAMGYKYLDTIPLGFDIGFLFNETWAVDVIATYDVHALGGLAQFKTPTPENVGVMVTVKKYF